jgi:hypothetical protein
LAVVVDVVVLILISPQALSRNDATTLAVLPVFWLSCRSDSKLFLFPPGRYICAKGFSDKIFEQVLRWVLEIEKKKTHTRTRARAHTHKSIKMYAFANTCAHAHANPASSPKSSLRHNGPRPLTNKPLRPSLPLLCQVDRRRLVDDGARGRRRLAPFSVGAGSQHVAGGFTARRRQVLHPDAACGAITTHAPTWAEHVLLA